MRRPTNNPLTPGYGFGSTLPPYSASNPHKGVDFRHSPDNKIYAPENGTITLRGSDASCGNKLWLQGPTGRHTFCHLSSFNVVQGQTVKEGQVLGVMGNTGQASGVHLHWVLLRNGQLVDPLKYVTGGDDMYNGKTAEQWHNEYQELKKERDTVTYPTIERQKTEINKLNETRKLLEKERDTRFYPFIEASKKAIADATKPL